MQHHKTSFTATDGTRIHAERWLPDADLRGVILLVHGVGEHIQRYTHVAAALVDAGYGVYGHDHRGYGRSGGERGHITSQRHFCDDLKQHYDIMTGDYPDARRFVLGHSMGSIVSLQFVIEYQPELNGLVVTGTATDVASTVSPLLRTAINTLYPFFPKLPVNPPLDDPTLLTSDPAMQARWKDDDYVELGWMRASIGKYIVDIGEMTQNRAGEIRLPLLVMHGSEDQIAPVSGSQIMYERAASADKTLKIWDAMQHEILNERERERVLDTIITWLNAH